MAPTPPPVAPNPYQQPAPPPQPQQYGEQGQFTNQAAHVGGQFPVAPPTQAPQPRSVTPRIAFNDALRGAGLDIGASSNPIIAAAADLLVLLGRLRTGLVEMQVIPLRDHVVREISTFVTKAQERGIAPDDIEVARYALAATADDVVQTIPGADPGYWQQFSMAAELLNDRSAGIGFFAKLDQVITLPSQRKDVLELMLTCLSLGFEGKFRTEPNGTVALTRLRNEVYQRIRSVEARPGHDISLKWLPVILGGRKRRAALPLWIVGGVAAAMVVALFATLSWVLSNEAQASQNSLLALHQNDAEIQIEPVVIEMTTTEEVIDPEITIERQLERIRGKLATQIANGDLSVDTKGEYVAIRMGKLQFKTASADLRNDVTELLRQIAEVLNAEQGDIVIEGHSDNQRFGGNRKWRDNEHLSEGRAQTVRDKLAELLVTPDRMSVVGVGPNDPINTANTREAHAENRRVEILVRKEQNL